MKLLYSLIPLVLLTVFACEADRDAAPDRQSEAPGMQENVAFMNLNPGHFHAGLIHLNHYPQVDSTVYVYAPEGEELNSYLNMIRQFNQRDENPTRWEAEVYTGEDYLQRMLEEQPGNVMVVAGNNARKIEYVSRAVDNGIHVLSDKPMIIAPDQFPLLQNALESADRQGIVLNDMMTERHEITNILMRELSQIPELFGEQRQGSPEEPAIKKESVHFFYKTVAGETLIRPAWFFDVKQQGEAIVDVSTHLVDQVLWKAFPDDAVDFRNPDDGVDVVHAEIWHTDLSDDQFTLITGTEAFPAYLMDDVEDNILKVASNGSFVFEVRGVYAKVSAQWGFTNPDGGDTHYSVMRGTRADLVIRQDLEQDFVATLYVVPADEADEDFERVLQEALGSLGDTYEGLSARHTEFGWEISIPEAYVETHEEHFTRVTQRFLEALEIGRIPEWERVNLETKYFLTTRAYEKSR
ncbi:putative oxidoreductase C-terminal domain-containing protein [Balneolales bacterium ANBcel1]|nr:putative oxidoreductase C-terminal domain-containing protein [Balneolales bacterium ANBcel1]